MATLRELKGRIGSVASSQKITGAMKMISSAKMHKAEQSLRRLQPFRGQIEQVIGNILGSDTPFTSPLMEEREVKKITILVFGSDDGLCGAYNVNIFKLLVTRVNELREKFGKNIAVEILPIGKKMQKAVSRIAAGNITLRTIDGIDSKTTGLGVKKFVDLLRDAFVAGDTDRVDYLYMNFRSVSRQRPVFGQFLPVTTQAFYAEGVRPSNRPYIFEPDAASIFNAALPMLLLAVMQDIFTENRASEQAARVMAMQSANDNATKLLEQLQLEYNKLRQQSITTELLDILGGQVK
ncbi:ATP synthase F1 subunit gamma [Muribaculaceae bacterium Isolate-104 (HZI)]|jgi:F-type H+-transporting ATPase subunit gamma|nr:ATP synthase F1 subunit gamma [Muribaculaceae bacterium Isolate-104 (HZI)]